jgi:hypothetical protein
MFKKVTGIRFSEVTGSDDSIIPPALLAPKQKKNSPDPSRQAIFVWPIAGMVFLIPCFIGLWSRGESVHRM